MNGAPVKLDEAPHQGQSDPEPIARPAVVPVALLEILE